MARSVPLAALLAVLASPGVAQATAPSPRIANYTITATYDGGKQTIRGHQLLRWRNATAEPAVHLYFHLYLNAFANSHSSFARKLGREWREWLGRNKDGWGYIEVESMRIGGADVTASLQFVQPDDGNIDDRTVVRVPLQAPLRPGEAVEVEVDFAARLPKIVARSGHAGPFALVAQWFPKIGVYENGSWNCHQYHATSEFFADFGVYDVTLTVPRDGVVGATGALQEERDNGDGTKTLRFVAEDVHDFAWAIDPRFQVSEEIIEGTNVRLLLQPNHRGQRERHLQAAGAAIMHYRDWIGAYPYAQLTIVDPGPGGGRAGGMEYPGLITVGTTWWMPRGIRLPEAVTVHEFGHQYWYGMVASNEFEEPWLDEGINSYVEGRVMDSVYGVGSYLDFMGVRADSAQLRRLGYLLAAERDPITRRAWEFVDRASYAATAYSKTALVLDTLDRHLGGDTVRRALAAYFERWRFRQPRGGDFLAAVSAAAGEDLGWYFDQVISGTGVLDYAVTTVDAEETSGLSGYVFDGARIGGEVTPTPEATRHYRNEVTVERLGSVRMPVEVHVMFGDGTSATEHWDGQERWKRFEYVGTQRVEWAVVDPRQTMPLDRNRLNNSRMRQSGTRGIVRLGGRWGFWFQNLVVFLTGL